MLSLSYLWFTIEDWMAFFLLSIGLISDAAHFGMLKFPAFAVTWRRKANSLHLSLFFSFIDKFLSQFVGDDKGSERTWKERRKKEWCVSSCLPLSPISSHLTEVDRREGVSLWDSEPHLHSSPTRFSRCPFSIPHTLSLDQRERWGKVG